MSSGAPLRDLPPVDVCSRCLGEGTVDDGDCPICGGTGKSGNPRLELPELLSQTFLKHHDRCERAAYLYLKFKGGPQTHEQARGTAFHEAAARMTAELIARDERTPPPDVAKAVLDEVLVERTDLVLPHAEREAVRGMVWNWSQATNIDPAQVVLVETMMVWEVAGVTIRGVVDLALDEGGLLVIRDYKTSLYVPPQSEFDGDFQTLLYGAMVAFGETENGERIGGGFNQFRFENVFPRYLRDDGTLATRSFGRTRTQLADLRGDLETQIARLRENAASGKWQPIPGTKQCGECPAEHECPIPVAYRPESELPKSLEEAQRLAEWRYGEKKRMERVGRKLKKFAEAEGVVIPIGDDLVLGFVKEEGERLKRKVRLEGGDVVEGKTGLRAGIEGAIEFGHPFDWTDYYEPFLSTKFKEIKRTDLEGDGE